MTSAKCLKTWQNARDGLTDLLGRPRERMRPLARLGRLAVHLGATIDVLSADERG